MDARLATYLTDLPSRSGNEATDPLAGTASSGVAFWRQLRATGLIWRFGTLLGMHGFETGLLLASWAFLGSGALSGRLDGGWLAAWALCLASTVPLRIATRWQEGVVAIGFSGLLKQRLLAGAMRMDADRMRRKGAGELLSEVLEAEAIERLAASGGLQTVLAALELLLVPFVLAWGAAARAEILLLAGWAGFALILIAHNLRQRFVWTTLRLRLTHRLVEKMSAHRTRLAQQPPSEWHRDEDRENCQYAEVSEVLDRSTARIEGALARGYMVAALAVLAPSFLAASATPGQQAVTLGAILFTGAAFERLGFGLARAGAAWIAWRCVKPVFDAATVSPAADAAVDLPSARSTVLQAQDLTFTHEGGTAPAVRDWRIGERKIDVRRTAYGSPAAVGWRDSGRGTRPPDARRAGLAPPHRGSAAVS